LWAAGLRATVSDGREVDECGGAGGVCFWISCRMFAAELELIADTLMGLPPWILSAGTTNYFRDRIVNG
jgi:hypothetical protein